MESFVFPVLVVGLSLPPYIKFPSIVNSRDGTFQLYQDSRFPSFPWRWEPSEFLLCIKVKFCTPKISICITLYTSLSVPKVRIGRKVFHQKNLSEELTEMHKKLNIPLQRCQLNHIDGYKSAQIKISRSAGEMQASFWKLLMMNPWWFYNINYISSGGARHYQVNLTHDGWEPCHKLKVSWHGQ